MLISRDQVKDGKQYLVPDHFRVDLGENREYMGMKFLPLELKEVLQNLNTSEANTLLSLFSVPVQCIVKDGSVYTKILQDDINLKILQILFTSPEQDNIINDNKESSINEIITIGDAISLLKEYVNSLNDIFIDISLYPDSPIDGRLLNLFDAILKFVDSIKVPSNSDSHNRLLHKNITQIWSDFWNTIDEEEQSISIKELILLYRSNINYVDIAIYQLLKLKNYDKLQSLYDQYSILSKSVEESGDNVNNTLDKKYEHCGANELVQYLRDSVQEREKKINGHIVDRNKREGIVIGILSSFRDNLIISSDYLNSINNEDITFIFDVLNYKFIPSDLYNDIQDNIINNKTNH